MKSTTDYQKIAAAWRKEQTLNRATAGVVLIWENKVYGWKDKLSDAAHERPNAVAVDVSGHVFIATGGDDEQGARAWVCLLIRS